MNSHKHDFPKEGDWSPLTTWNDPPPHTTWYRPSMEWTSPRRRFETLWRVISSKIMVFREEWIAYHFNDDVHLPRNKIKPFTEPGCAEQADIK